MKRTFIQENLPILLATITVLCFSSLPLWLGKSLENNDFIFRGAFYDTSDYSVHISMMQAGRMGDWTYQMRFTSEEHTAVFVRVFYILLGHVSGWLGLGVKTTYQLARWVFGVLALVSVFKLFQKIFGQNKLTWAAFWLAVFGSGVGWLQLLLGMPLEPISPIDFWLIDAYLLFSISIFPSFSFTLALMATALRLFLEYVEGGKWSLIFWISLSAVVSQIVNPIAFAVIDLTLAGMLSLTWWKNQKIDLKQVFALGTIAAVQLPLLIYNLRVLQLDPVWSQFTLQNETLSPPPLFYFWGFLLFWLFAIWGGVCAWREKNPTLVAMTFWAVSGFALAYAPVLIQRRFLLGITIPLAALAVHGLSDLLALVGNQIEGWKKREALVHFTYILLASISALFFTLSSCLQVLSKPPTLFYPRDFADAIQWLDENAKPNDIVFGSLIASQIIAEETQLKVYAGHPMETLNFEEKKLEVVNLYEGGNSSKWLSQTPVEWVIYGPYERENGAGFTPSDNLIQVYQNNTVTVYQVMK
ncbi:MAG TPA: hypothetical protein PKL78_10515 [Anaerolineales bacterium]|nr:hypothetical protein [Anaerolineales bacterium]